MTATRYWLDTEFYEDGRTIDLISIGVDCEDGREYYAESRDFNWDRVPPGHWLWENVHPHLERRTPVVRSRSVIAADLVDFIRRGRGGLGGGHPEFWGYYADYDWIVLCQLFGTMVDLPEGWPMLCLDVRQLALQLGDPRLPEQTGTEHHALVDARWTRRAWEFLEARR